MAKQNTLTTGIIYGPLICFALPVLARILPLPRVAQRVFSLFFQHGFRLLIAK